MDVQWFKNLQKQRGVTADDIAKAMGRSRSNVSNIYAGNQRMSLDWAKAFADTLGVTIDEVLERSGALDAPEARNFKPGYSESDAILLPNDAPGFKKSQLVARAFGYNEKSTSIWSVQSAAMSLAGYLKGDQVLVDKAQSSLVRVGDVVVAQRFDHQAGAQTSLLRRYEPPVLVADSPRATDRRVLIVDENNVFILGKVIAQWRSEFETD